MGTVEFKNLNGTLVPYEDGIALGSAQIVEEAKAWVQKQDLAAPFGIILGLGAGHHVAEWLALSEQSHAIVIDPRPGLLSSFRASFPDIQDRCDVLTIDSLDGLMKHEVLSFVAEALPPVLVFQPAFGTQGDLFQSMFATLTGRNVWGLRYFLQTYGFDSAVELEASAQGRLLTIRDLGLIVDVSKEGHPRASAVRVLKELIA